MSTTSRPSAAPAPAPAPPPASQSPALLQSARQPVVWPYGALFAAAGVFMLVYAAASAPPAWMLHTVVTECGTDPSAPHAVLLGAVLIVIGRGLAGRRRVCWAIGLCLVAWSALTEVEAAALRASAELWRLVPLLLVAVALIWARDGFVVRPDRRRLHQSLVSGAAAGTVLLLLGGGSLFAERGRFAEPKSTAGLGRALVAAVAANSGPGDFQGPGWMLPALALAAGATLLALLWWLAAPSPAPEPAGDAERAAMRALVADPGSDSLAPFALRRDKSYVFEPGRRAAVSYRVLAGAAVASGDPVGAPEAWPDAIAAFLDHAERHGWRPAVLGAGPRSRQLWAAQGMHGFGIGDEVLVEAAGFTLSGRSMRNVRQAVRRSENAGIEVAVLPERRLSPTLAAELRAIHRAWLGRGRSRGREHGFAMNLDAMAEGKHPDALMFIAFAADGYAVSFQRYLPAAGAGPNAILSLDVMPRDRVAPNGVTEHLIVAAIAYAEANGYAAVSLNFAAFRPVLEAYRGIGSSAAKSPSTATATATANSTSKSGSAGRGTRALRRAILLLDPLVQVESLYRFNAKFQPGWTPRAILVRSWLDVPRFAVAAFGLEFGLPYDRHRSRPGAPAVRHQPVAAPHGEAAGAAEESALGALRQGADGPCFHPGD